MRRRVRVNALEEVATELMALRKERERLMAEPAGIEARMPLYLKELSDE